MMTLEQAKKFREQQLGGQAFSPKVVQEAIAVIRDSYFRTVNMRIDARQVELLKEALDEQQTR